MKLWLFVPSPPQRNNHLNPVLSAIGARHILISIAVMKYPDNKQLREEKGSFGLQVQVPVLHLGEVKTDLNQSHSQEQRRINTCLLVCWLAGWLAW